MQCNNVSIRQLSRSAPLSMALAMTAEEVQEAQQLRYRAFCEELGARLETGEAGLDSDHFDPYCDTCWSGIPYETRRSPAPGS